MLARGNPGILMMINPESAAMSQDDFEQRLKAFAQREANEHPAPPPEQGLDKALQRAQRDTAYKEGLGFLTAILWVFISGLGLNLYRAVKTPKPKSKPKHKPKSRRQPATPDSSNDPKETP